MNNYDMFKLLLNYVIKKSFIDKQAFDILCKYDAKRTNRKLEDVIFINQALRSKNKQLFNQAIKLSTKL